MTHRANEINAEENSHVFYSKEQAFNNIRSHIKWGQSVSINSVEQGGILLGQTYIDPENKETYCIVEQSIPGNRAKGSSTYLKMTHETWKEMIDTVDKLHSKLQIVGWYHTHPNNLDVFMSETDIATQARIFGNDWQFAIVLNPQKKIWRVFYGVHSKECKGYVVDLTE